MQDEMALDIYTGVDDSFSPRIDRLRRPNNNKGETTLLNNIQQQFRLQPSLCKDIQRNTYSNKECFTYRLWINEQVQSSIWKCYKRNKDRELPIQLEQWGKLETDNKGGQ